jgi:hypothetical protein
MVPVIYDQMWNIGGIVLLVQSQTARKKTIIEPT